MEGLRSWNDFFGYLCDQDTKTKGDLFELFSKVWLEAQDWVEEVSFYRDFPVDIKDQLGIAHLDQGTDLVIQLARTHNHRHTHMAVQCKFRTDTQGSMRLSELGNFQSDARAFGRGLLMTTKRLPTPSYVKSGMMDHVLWSGFEETRADRMAGILARVFGHRVPSPKPMKLREYQLEAMNGVMKAYKASNTASIHAATGSGKTFMSYAVAMSLAWNHRSSIDAIRMACFVPTLTLMAQNVRYYSGRVQHILAICCEREYEHTAEFGIHATTDLEQIVAFLEAVQGDSYVVLSTYKSKELLVKAVHLARLETGMETGQKPFDVVVFDEAHELVGQSTKQDSKWLLKSGVREIGGNLLYQTATPKDTANGKGVSMDNRELFGPVAFEYPYARGIREKTLADCRIRAPIVGCHTLELMKVSLDLGGQLRGDGISPRTLLAAFLCMEAWNEGKHKILVFCASLDESHDFLVLMETLIKLEGDPGLKPFLAQVDGNYGLKKRQFILDNFRRKKHALVTSVRTLCVGFDAPECDAVCFTHDVGETYLIMQMIGRGTRFYRNPETGEVKILHILVPTVTGVDPDEEEEFFEEAEGDLPNLRRILATLKTRGDMERDVVGLKARMLTGGLRVGRGLSTKMPRKVEEELMREFELSERLDWRSHVFDAMPKSQVEKALECREWCLREGRVPKQSEKPWGPWISERRQDYKKGKLAAEVVEALEAIFGWYWALDHTAAYLEMAEKIRLYQLEHGEIPNERLKELGIWIRNRRNDYKKGKLAAEVVEALEAIPGWYWAIDHTAAYLEMAEKVRLYQLEHGEIPGRSHKELGIWINSRRQDYKKGKLASEAVEALEAIPGWWWALDQTAAHLEMVEKVRLYRLEHGKIPNERHKELGIWINSRRQDYKKGKLAAEVVEALEAIPGWWWALDQTGAHLEMAEKVRLYQLEHGEIPTIYHKELGKWINSRRQDYKKGKLATEAVEALETVPGWWWALDHTGAHLEMTEKVRLYQLEHGEIPTVYHKELGKWISKRRQDYKKGKLAAEVVEALEAIPGWWWSREDKLSKGV